MCGQLQLDTTSKNKRPAASIRTSQCKVPPKSIQTPFPANTNKCTVLCPPWKPARWLLLWFNSTHHSNVTQRSRCVLLQPQCASAARSRRPLARFHTGALTLSHSGESAMGMKARDCGPLATDLGHCFMTQQVSRENHHASRSPLSLAVVIFQSLI